MKIVAIVLTRNEERHLQRCIDSLVGIVSEIVVADCFSDDRTVEIALRNGARVVQRAWDSHASQFNWALTQLGSDTQWVLRIDADETVAKDLADEITAVLPCAPQTIAGFYCRRRIWFEGRPIRYGGIFPIRVMRLFRFGMGRCEDRLMDEHIRVSGKTGDLQGEIVDNNLNSLTWWTQKHNQYASLEAVEVLVQKHALAKREARVGVSWFGGTDFKRLIKEKVYLRTPSGVRALAYFLYRYVLRMGFLDGRAGADFHVLQGFWYRYLVDAKVAEVDRYVKNSHCSIEEAIEIVLGLRV